MKNIDRLFQEKIKDLEVSPDPKIWSAIESKLKKKKRRVFPFWWLSGGVAALLIFGLLLFPFSNDEPQKLEIQERPVITSTPEESLPVKIDSSKQFFTSPSKEKTVIANKKSEKESQKKKTIDKNTPRKGKSVLAENIIKKEESIKNPTNQKPTNKKIKTIDKKPLGKVLIAEHTKDSVQKKKPLLKKDFIATTKENDNLKVKKENQQKWSVSSAFAILNSNSFTNSSPITSDLNSNPKKGENTFSYGVKVAYQLNNKWSFQSGVHLQKMSFLTKNVSIASGTSQNNIETINFNNSTSYYLSNTLENISFDNSSIISNNAELQQVFNYVEIPFELKYHFVHTKDLKTSVVAGFSSLLLINNEINAKTTSSSQTLGKANNLNSLNFSGNFGFDVDYTINKHWIINLNPMFKSHLNTFSKNSNGFKPYFFGIYSGVKYSF